MADYDLWMIYGSLKCSMVLEYLPTKLGHF